MMHHDSLMNAKIGDKLPVFVFGPVSRGVLALYAGASGDHNLIHIDSDYAKNAGLPDVFAQGMLSFGVLAQVATRWAGIEHLRAFGARFVSITQVHDLITCTGEIIERMDVAGETQVCVALTATAQDGRQTLTGEAIVALR